LIATQLEFDKAQYRITRAIQLERPIVSEQFILDSITKGELLDIADYKFTRSTIPPEEEISELDNQHMVDDDGEYEERVSQRKKRAVSLDSPLESIEEEAVNMLKDLSNNNLQLDVKETKRNVVRKAKQVMASVVINNPVDCIFEFAKK
jgi:DUF4097 and DUF4098 domain-containing protein YvlB